MCQCHHAIHSPPLLFHHHFIINNSTTTTATLFITYTLIARRPCEHDVMRTLMHAYNLYPPLIHTWGCLCTVYCHFAVTPSSSEQQHQQFVCLYVSAPFLAHFTHTWLLLAYSYLATTIGAHPKLLFYCLLLFYLFATVFYSTNVLLPSCLVIVG